MLRLAFDQNAKNILLQQTTKPMFYLAKFFDSMTIISNTVRIS
jgi:hypothetical protein